MDSSAENQQLPYLICEGTDEPWVETVHGSWYDEEKKLCFWPPNVKDSNKLRGFVLNGYQPDSDWIGYPAKIRKAYETYEKAMSRMRRAIQNSYDLLDTTDTEIAKKRIRVSNPRYHHNSEPGVLKEKHPSRQKVKKLDDVRRGPIPAPPPSPFQPVSQKTNAPNSKNKSIMAPAAVSTSTASTSSKVTVSKGCSSALVIPKNPAKLPEKGFVLVFLGVYLKFF